MRATLPHASVLLLGVVVAVLVGPCRSSVTQEPMNNDQLSSHTPTSAELIQSVMVNQMTLLRMLNQSSINCSPNELAMAAFVARQEDAKEELRRSLEAALKMLNEKKEEALDEITEKKIQSETDLASFKNSALEEMTGAKQHITYELKAAREVAPGSSEDTKETKIFQKYTESLPHKQAMEACLQKGGRIAVPLNPEEDSQLTSLVAEETSTYDSYWTGYWIGVDDREKEDEWVDSNTGLPVAYKNFQGVQPDNFGEHGEDCVVLLPWDSWNDFPCAQPAKGYLCEFSVEKVHTL
ncbi:tetranectin-like [Portunus trituberculatus]|uniref:tetranectin-like n=1 Tax=Portunus trituberculatus TaxID=210409 RepID=UPI001E1CDFF7|nr:tetranectin-like [Portunus trituberculatus]